MLHLMAGEIGLNILSNLRQCFTFHAALLILKLQEISEKRVVNQPVQLIATTIVNMQLK